MEHHPLIETSEAAGWVTLECPVCPSHAATVWKGSTPRIEPLGKPRTTPGVVHAWTRTILPD